MMHGFNLMIENNRNYLIIMVKFEYFPTNIQKAVRSSTLFQSYPFH